MPPKKSRSNNQLGSETVLPLRNLIGSDEREPITILELSKKTRTISRVIQLVLLIIIFSMLTKVDYRGFDLAGLSVLYWILCLIAFGLDLMDLGLYYSPFVANWSNQKIVMFETFSDISITVLFIVGFISQVASKHCPPGTLGCDSYNSITAFSFFSTLTWGYSSYYDIRAYTKIRASQRAAGGI